MYDFSTSPKTAKGTPYLLGQNKPYEDEIGCIASVLLLPLWNPP
jgi:hypothetical protein